MYCVICDTIFFSSAAVCHIFSCLFRFLLAHSYDPRLFQRAVPTPFGVFYRLCVFRMKEWWTSEVDVAKSHPAQGNPVLDSSTKNPGLNHIQVQYLVYIFCCDCTVVCTWHEYFASSLQTLRAFQIELRRLPPATNLDLKRSARCACCRNIK